MLDPRLRAVIQQKLEDGDSTCPRGKRLVDDARRQLRRVRWIAAAAVVPAKLDLDALELATFALQLPVRNPRDLPRGRLGVTSLRDRADLASQQLIEEVDDMPDESLLDRTTRLLHELHQHPPVLDEAKLLADAINLEDFGVTGLMRAAVSYAMSGRSLDDLHESIEKREVYGYWDARLKDGFNFDAARQIARRRLDTARSAATLLLNELAEEDRPA